MMSEKEIDAELTMASNLKTVNEKYIERIINIIDDVLASKDWPEIEAISSIMGEEGFIISGTSFFFKNVIMILKLEINMYGEPLFWKDCFYYRELADKYTKTIHMLRRLEFGGEEDFIEEAMHFLLTQKISIYAIKIILSVEYFEKKYEIIRDLFWVCQSLLNEEERKKWLCIMAEFKNE